MSARTLACAALIAAALSGGAPGARAENIAVVLDHAKVMKLPDGARTVVVGNPAIADVAVQKSGVMVITGKSFGVTNLIALDASGALIAESNVSVQPPVAGMVVVQRGLDRESYSCTPVCAPALVPGDGQSFFGNVNTQTTSRNTLAAPPQQR